MKTTLSIARFSTDSEVFLESMDYSTANLKQDFYWNVKDTTTKL